MKMNKQSLDHTKFSVGKFIALKYSRYKKKLPETTRKNYHYFHVSVLDHIHPCNSNFRFSYSYLSLSAHLQVHKSVHLSDASLHLHLVQDSDLQVHFTNSLASLQDSYCDIHFGSQVQLDSFVCFQPIA